MTSTPKADGLSSIIDNYDCVLCDVWGVLHNGKNIWPDAANALISARQSGAAVVMITNAPRPKGPVTRHLGRMRCPEGVFDDLVTSGDVTRQLIAELNGPVYHIGREQDKSLYEGLGTVFADPQDAAGIVCTSLFDDRSEHPDDYVERFRQYVDLGLPFICANPDIVVEVVDQLLWCAGALAREYRALGGETKIVGKPHRPIYQEAIARAETVLGREIDRSRILAIGDGLPTDVLGAKRNEIDCLFITNGIHAAEYTSGDVDEPALQAFLKANEANPTHWLKTLVW